MIAVADKIKAQFWPKVDKSDGCWSWSAAHNPSGYGVMSFEGKRQLATHVAWWLENGVWPTLFVLHKCDNPLCVRIDHLFLGTQTDNMRDCAKKGRLGGIFQVKEKCKHGHPMKNDNVGIIDSKARGKRLRYCRACAKRSNDERKEYKHQWYIKRKQLIGIDK
jgi:hypothetical protein